MRPMRPSRPHPPGHVVNVGAHLLAKIGNLVDIGDLGGKKGVGGVFDELRGLATGEQNWRLDQVERIIEMTHEVAGAVTLGPDHHPVGTHEIVDGGALAQEFRIRDHIEIGVLAGIADNALHLTPGAHRHRRFVHHHRIAVEGGGNLLGRGEDIGKIGMTVAAPARRADGDEDGIGLGHSGLQVGAKRQPPGIFVVPHHFLETRLVNGNLALAQAADLIRVLINTDHVDAKFRKTGTGDKSYIPGANYGYMHGVIFPGWALRPP